MNEFKEYYYVKCKYYLKGYMSCGLTRLFNCEVFIRCGNVQKVTWTYYLINRKHLIEMYEGWE